MCVVMTKQIIALVALLSIGAFSAVYAETTTVEVPFNSHGQTCNFDEIAVEYMCVWQGFKEVYTLEDSERLQRTPNRRKIRSRDSKTQRDKH